MNKYHVTWFIDDKKTKLSGLTVEAKSISEAIKKVVKQKILESNIKYVIEL
jgi:hypothetical protein